MKIHLELEMTPEEARRFLGMPDMSKIHEMALSELQKRMSDALASDAPEAMLKAWMSLGGQGLDQIQRFLWDSASRMNAAGSAKRDANKSRR